MSDSLGGRFEEPTKTYMQRHAIGPMVESLLMQCVPSRDPRPYEVVSMCTPRIAPLVKDGHSITQLVRRIEGQPVGASPVSAADLQSLSFNVLRWDTMSDDLVFIVWDIFAAYGLPAAVPYTADVFVRWVLTVRDNYHPENPYHNFHHAMATLQTLHALLQLSRLHQRRTPSQLFAALFAALCHDVQHGGVTNAFLVDTLHPLALRYGDRAVWEHHHAAVALAIPAAHSAADVLRAYRGDGRYATNETFRHVRRDVVRFIMATDVGSHHTLMERLEANPEDVETVMEALIVASDIGTEIRPLELSLLWAPRVACEFEAQGKVEKSLGMPVKPMNDGTTARVPQSQCGFIKNICLPFYTALVNALPSLLPCLEQLRRNLQHWEEAAIKRESNNPPQPY